MLASVKHSCSLFKNIYKIVGVFQINELKLVKFDAVSVMARFQRGIKK
jgi:hypothetical protein